MQYNSEDISVLSDIISKAQDACKTLIANQDDARRRFYGIDNILSVVTESLRVNDISYFKFIELLDQELRKPESSVEKYVDTNDTINKHQYDELIMELDGLSSLAKEIMKVYNISSLADLPACEYRKARNKIKKIKDTEKDYARSK